MRILLIEDQNDKIVSIKQCISDTLTENKYELIPADCLADARRLIIAELFDLIIFDIYLPLNDAKDSPVTDISSDIIREFSKSKNYQTEAIAITGYDVTQIENLHLFNESGVTVVSYSSDDTKWHDSLKLKLNRIVDKVKYDFLIFCALSKERQAYSQSNANFGDLKIIRGLNCQDIKIGGYSGLCITPARMGLVSMGIVASKAIEFFQPKIVAMSGICAGVLGESNLLDLIIGDVCWEYQTGKFKDNSFKQEPYQSTIDSNVRVEIDQLIQSKNLLGKLKEGLFDSELKDSKVIIAPISSGSAVIASASKMAEIGTQHRKMAGLEMEMYSLYEAASQSPSKPLYFGAKAVVDLGDSSKGDQLHSSATIISARFVVTYLESSLPTLC
ncbi:MULTISPECIES: hypothetical protein [unclassified Colwellia]|uniref:hypothetical protein n=1 Tax=unclassified Colwellia TaxID=196834 RepID=UPI0015F523B2|nr:MULTISPECIES: hypothetical protein [unclassified Colwellia]MBA6354904.1 hypothetical protein [Colwellia sp. BRX8-3]MBA6360256.1 hypothetical protein [Colwellia sp. BRX8-6]MBA6367669.1 hypothetical protein [Colwellia sp. BRX8-5]MBA6374713.1 hypothetical protein [Colwellia sp. BRX8-2]